MAHRDVRELVRQGGTLLARQLRVAFGLFDQRVLDRIRPHLRRRLAPVAIALLLLGRGEGHGHRLPR